jgi:hypothetical protein
VSRRAALQAARIALVPSLALAVVVALVPSRAELVVHLWLLVVLGSVALAGLAALRRTYPHGRSPFDRRPPRRDTPGRFPSLERMEREVALAATTAHDVHFRLRPTARALTTELLAANRGLRLDESPDQARELIGPEAWELVRADRQPPADPRGPGLDREVIERIVARLESLSPGTT